MNIDEESKVIKESIKNTLSDLNKYPKNFPKEEDIQLRLYVHLCNEFHDIEKGSFGKIKLEYNPFPKEQRILNSKYASQLSLDQSYFNHMFNPNNIKYEIKPNNFKKFISDFSIMGKFDIVIFDGTNKVRHAIEIKKLCEAAVQPELKSETHRPLEDIYVLTNLLKPKYSTEISEYARGYNLIYAEKNENSSKPNDYYEKITAFLKDIKKAYKDAGLFYLSINFNGKKI